jgi:hypothetical protein
MKPTCVPIWLACRACNYQWDDWQPCDVPVATWLAHCRTWRCPACGKGGRNVLLRGTARAAELSR